jgi:hypothetical protein
MRLVGEFGFWTFFRGVSLLGVYAKVDEHCET